MQHPTTDTKGRTFLRTAGARARTAARCCLCAVLLIALSACGSSNDRSEKPSYYKGTSARPGPAPASKVAATPKWVEPSEPVDRKLLKLKRGETAHITVTADTFEAAGMLPKFREKLVGAIEDAEVFGQINIDGNEGHIALDVVLIDTREGDGILFLPGARRFKVRLTVTDTRTTRRLSPADPENLFYGNIRQVVKEIATYIAS